MKFGSDLHKAEIERRRVESMADLIPGQMYKINCRRGDVISGIPHFEIFPSYDHVDWDDVGYEPLRPVRVELGALVMFIESKFCFSFPSDARTEGSKPGEETHYRFLWGEREFWLPHSRDYDYEFFLHDTRWQKLIDSEEFKRTFEEHKAKYNKEIARLQAKQKK